MIRNYFKIAYRNLAKYKFISFINLFGLSVGLACCLLILSYVLNELSYDRYNAHADRIYRVTRNFYGPDHILNLRLGGIAPPFGPLLQNDFSDIQQITRLLPNGTVPVKYKENIFNEKNSYFADEHLADVFDMKVLKGGDPHTALVNPFSIMMTEETAKKYFGNEDPVNKQLLMNNQFNCTITGVYKAFPENAHFHPNMLISFNTLRDSTIYGEKNLRTNFGNNAFFTYLLLPKDYPAASMEKRFPAFLDKNMPRMKGANAANLPSKGTSLFLQKLTDIHLRSHLDEEMEENGDITRVYVFGAVALFILLIACINYMNLSTARSTLRAKEIGIRKVAGAERGEIIAQFLSESVMVSLMATGLAVCITWLSLPWLNTITGQALTIAILLKWQVLLPLVIAPFAVGILSGLYPALFMSSFQPAKVLKGIFKAGGSNVSFRKILVVTQFSISIILIISTAVVFQQLHYMQEKSLGFDKEHVVTTLYENGLNANYETFRNELLQDSYIKDATRSSRIPSGRLLDEQGASMEAGDSLRPVNANIKYLAADYEFVPTYGIPIVAGRNFSRDYATDSSSFLLNVAATQILGMKTPAEAVGKNFQYGGAKGKVVGVIGDFHFESMHQRILPMILVMPPASQAAGFFNNISIKISGGNTQATLAHIEKTWKKFLPQTPFEYNFLNERFEQLYRSEQRQGTLFTAFACIAIFIACLGLFGLSSFSITQRIKEIGVRKVLGASVGSIVTLLSKDFLKLVAIAALIAFPVAWFAMHSWLEDFAYRIRIAWWLFLLAGILAAVVALVTISFLAIRAALANPVKSLRTE